MVTKSDRYHILLTFAVPLYLCGLFHQVSADHPEATSVTIGALFETRAEKSYGALKFAVDYVNEKKLLGKNVHMRYISNQTFQERNSFDVIQKFCDQASHGVAAFVGPFTSSMVRLAAPLVNKMNVPLIAPFATSPLLDQVNRNKYIIRMSPPDSIQGIALADLISHFGWKKLTVLTSDTIYGIYGIRSFIFESARQGVTILSLQHFQSVSDLTSLDVTAHLKAIQDLGARVVVLHCESAFGPAILEQAGSLNMTTEGWAWIVTDGITQLDRASSPDLLGVIGTRPAMGQGILWEEMNSRWQMADQTTYHGAGRHLHGLQSRIIDSVLAFTYGYRDQIINHSRIAREMPLTCLSGTKWTDGKYLLNSITQIDGHGVSGQLQFNDARSPAHAVFDYVNMQEDGWKKVGEWTTKQRISLTVPSAIRLAGGRRTVADEQSTVKGRRLRVVVIEEAPFVTIEKNTENETSQLHRQDIKGFCIDLLDELARIIGFTYDLYLVPDGKFGSKEPPHQGQWNGIVGELVNRKADLAAAPLSINVAREEDIDFTKPYYYLGFITVIQQPPPEAWDPFKFTRPFSAGLWYFILGTTALVGIYVSFLNKLSPYDVHGHYVYKDQQRHAAPTKRDTEEGRWFERRKTKAISQLDFNNSFWLSLSSLMHQGSEAYPRGLSARLSVLVWWMGVTFLIATYTATLAAHLTSTRDMQEVASVEDLAKQSSILYGTVVDSAPHQFFSDSEVPLYTDMLEVMRSHKTLVSNSSEGFEKARRGKYAFIWDSAVIEYVIQQPPCNTLRPVGRRLGQGGYGFGLQKNSLYTTEISQNMLVLKEAGFMDQLKEKWFKGDCAPYESPAKSIPVDPFSDANSGYVFSKLDFRDKIQGVFIIVWAGCGTGFIALLVEWFVACVYAVDKRNPDKPQTIQAAFRYRLNSLKNDLLERYWTRHNDRAGSNTDHFERQEVNANGSAPGMTQQGTSLHVTRSIPRCSPLQNTRIDGQRRTGRPPFRRVIVLNGRHYNINLLQVNGSHAAPPAYMNGLTNTALESDEGIQAHTTPSSQPIERIPSAMTD